MAEYICRVGHKQITGKGKFILRKPGDGPVEFDINPGQFWKLAPEGEPAHEEETKPPTADKKYKRKKAEAAREA